MAEIVPIHGRGFECNSYLVCDDRTVLIDTGTGTSSGLLETVFKHVKAVDMIIDTHAHYDHVGGNNQFKAEIAIHRLDSEELEAGGLYGTSALFGKSARSTVDRHLEDGDIIETGDLSLKVIHTPGHTPGSLCLLSNEGHLFSGDTLFSEGNVGRTDLPGGRTGELLESLERLKRVSFEYLMPGHMDWVENGRWHLEAALELFEGLL